MSNERAWKALGLKRKPTDIEDHRTGRIDDAAEQWLKQNDPEYSAAKHGWIVGETDVLARSEEIHPSLLGLQAVGEIGSGNYRRGPTTSGDDTEYEDSWGLADELDTGEYGDTPFDIGAQCVAPEADSDLRQIPARCRCNWRQEIPRLKAAGWSLRRIGARLGVSYESVRKVLKQR